MQIFRRAIYMPYAFLILHLYTLKRYPTPQIVSMYCGLEVLNSIF